MLFVLCRPDIFLLNFSICDGFIEGCHHEIMKIIEPWNSYEPADRKI